MKTKEQKTAQARRILDALWTNRNIESRDRRIRFVVLIDAYNTHPECFKNRPTLGECLQYAWLRKMPK